MCVYACVCMTEVGDPWGGTRLGKRDLHTYYTLYCVCMIISGRNRGAAAKKRTQLGSRS